MTSVVTGNVNQSRGTRDRAAAGLAASTTQTTQNQKQIQATAEQIRLAQMISQNEAEFDEAKVKMLMEVTGKTQDECIGALHDCGEDVNRATNVLLESTTESSWETVSRKRVPSEIKETKEKRGGGERDASRGRGGSNRRGRGASRSREVRAEENGFETGPGERGGDRGRRGRGRGAGVRGRGGRAAAVGARFSSQGMGTFNPADYSANSGGARQETWETDGNETREGTWRGSLEDWAAEDWNEDLSETKVFTASASPANHITPGHNMDLSSLLPKAGGPGGVGDVEVGGLEPSSDGLGQSLVFTNSHHNGRTATHSYAHAAGAANSYAAAASGYAAHATLSSVLGSGFGALSTPKPAPSDVRTSDPHNGPHLPPRANQPLVIAAVKEPAPPTAAPAPAAPVVSNEFKPLRVENGPVTAPHLDLKTQPEPSAVLSQLAQRQQQPPPQPPAQPPAQVPTPPGHDSLLAAPPRDGPSPADIPTEMPQKQIPKIQRRRMAPPSKIPSSAVEMPGSADVSGLNFQFGALDFGSEPSVVADLGHSEPPAAPAPVPQQPPPQPSHFPNPGIASEPLGNLPPAVSDPSFPSPSLGLPSATPSASLGLASISTTPVTAPPPIPPPNVSRSLPPHLGFPSSKEGPPAGAVPNGFSEVRSVQTQCTPAVQTQTQSQCVQTQSSPDAVSSAASRTPKPDAVIMSSDSGPAHHVPAPAPVTSHSTPLPALSHVASSHSPASALSTSSAFTMASEESSSSSNAGASSLHTSFSSSSPSSIPSAVSSTPSSNGMAGAPGLTPNGGNVMLSAAGRSAQLATSGKAPPNLAQGVPPMLANQYIMGPGGLLPAYPQIYGYEDLQMLQSRLPMDYYGVTYPGNTATMGGRDGLANNPYSGEATKFGRADASSPTPATSLSGGQSQSQQQAPQVGGGGQGGSQQAQSQQNQSAAFLNPPLPPGYGYTGLPYYAGMPAVPSAFQYGPTVFVPPASAKQPTMGMGNPSSQYHQQHQPTYGQHAYTTAFDDLSQGHAGEYNKGGYGGSGQSQVKSGGSGPGKAPGLSGSGNSGGMPDMGASIYNKTQSFDKQGFHTATPPPFSLPSALGGTGPLNPGGAPGYAPAPFLHILPPHQQHSQLMHHHLAQDGQGGPGQRSQSSSMQQKSQGNKSNYGSSPYWAN